MMETKGVAMLSPEKAHHLLEHPARPLETDSWPQVGQAPRLELGNRAKEIVHVAESEAQWLAGVLDLQSLPGGVEGLLPLAVLESFVRTGDAAVVLRRGLGDKCELLSLQGEAQPQVPIFEEAAERFVQTADFLKQAAVEQHALDRQKVL